MIEFTNDCIELTTHGLLKYILKLTEMITKSDKRGDMWKGLAVKRGSKITQLKADLEELKAESKGFYKDAKLQTIRANRLERVIVGMNNSLTELINNNEEHVSRTADNFDD